MLSAGLRLLTAQAVVLDQQGRVLLLFRRWPPGWEPPGGHVDRGEDPAATVRRESLEETGLELEVQRLVGYYRFTGIRRGTDAVFRARIAGGSARVNREAWRLDFFDPGRLPDSLFPWFRQRIADALEGAAPPVERVQRVGLDHVLRHGWALAAGTAAELQGRVGSSARR